MIDEEILNVVSLGNLAVIPEMTVDEKVTRNNASSTS